MGKIIFLQNNFVTNYLKMTGELEYEVDKILDKRTSNGKVEYYLSWKNMGPSENSWEHKADMNCKELIKVFEDMFKEKKKKFGMMGSIGTGENVTKPNIPELDKDWTFETRPRGFDRGLIAERIVALTHNNENKRDLLFLMKWKGSDDLDLVPAKVANIKCPQIVIQFYEERNMWHTSSQDENE